MYTPSIAQESPALQVPRDQIERCLAEWDRLHNTTDWWIYPLAAGAKNPGDTYYIKWKLDYILKEVNPYRLRTVYETATYGLWLATGQVSKVVVFDEDKPGARDWLVQQVGEDVLNRTLQARTRRGRHYYFEIPASDTREWCSYSDERVGYDFRADNTGVVLPPSLHKSGHVYEWIGGKIQPAPESLRQSKSRRPPSAARKVCVEPEGTAFGLKRLEDLLNQIRNLEEGGRNHGVTRYAFMVGQWIGGGEISEEYGVSATIEAVYEVTDDEKDVYSAQRALEDGIDSPKSASNGLREIRMRDGAQLINELTDALNSGAIPDLFAQPDSLVLVQDVHGDPNLPVGEVRKGVKRVNHNVLGAQLARHVFVYTVKDEKRVREQPYATTLQQVLENGPWPNIAPLMGITRVPVLRADGTVLNTPGYDRSSGLYFDPRCDFSNVTTDPTADEVAAARSFLLDELLADFPFTSTADVANYVALLATPALRRFISGGVVEATPFGLVNAHTAGTGKTLLVDLIRETYGGGKTDFVDDETELRKVITSVLRDHVGSVVLLDNVKSGHEIRSATLSALLTSSVWSGRILGSSQMVPMPNDMLWMATGNNVRLGGDNASRTIMVNVDAGLERPDLRGGFKIANLDTWIKSSANQAKIVQAMLTLGRAWVMAGAPSIDTRMRGYATWASAMAGFLDFHQIPGFLTNADKVMEADTERQRWGAFLATWHEKFGSDPQRVKDILHSNVSVGPDEWGDAFVLVDAKTGNNLSVVKAGNTLSEKVKAPIDGFTLYKKIVHKSNVYWVEGPGGM